MAKSRIEQEKETASSMIRLYCKKHHGTKNDSSSGLCSECEELLNYAGKRLQSCRFSDNKSTCAKCPVHCYKPEMRERIIKVMRYSGPRMMYVHPVKAIQHLIGD